MNCFTSNILIPLQGSSVGIIVGFSSLAIAIVVFVSGHLNRYKDSDLIKNFILDNTKIRSCFYSTVITLFLSLSYVCLPLDEYEEWKLLICVVGIIYLLSILYCVVNVCFTFFHAIKLISDRNYWKKHKDQYVLNYCSKFSKNATKKIEKSMTSWKNLNEYIDNQLFFSFMCDFERSDYKPIYSSHGGTFDIYNIDGLTKLQDGFILNDQINNINIFKNQPGIILVLEQGQKLYKGKSIGYVRNDLSGRKIEGKNISDLLNDCISTLSGSMVYDKLFVENLRDSFLEADSEEKFDASESLMMIYEKLLKENCTDLGYISEDFIRKYVYKYCEIDKLYSDKTKSLISFLIFLSKQAISFEDEYFIQLLTSSVGYIYNKKLHNSNNVKAECKNFALDIRGILFFAKQESPLLGYSFYLKLVLTFLLDLIKIREYESAVILLKNLKFELEYNNDSNNSSINSLRMQFAMCFIEAMCILVKKGMISSGGSSSITKILSYIKEIFISYETTWKAIIKYRENSNYATCITEYYNHLDYLLEDNDYLVMSTFNGVNEIENLKECLKIYGKTLKEGDEINDVKKGDYQFCINLIEALKNESPLDLLLGIEANKDLLDDLERVKELAKMKLDESYNQSLDKEKVDNFLVKVVSNLREEEYTFSRIRHFNVVQNKPGEQDKLFGICTMLERSNFIENNVCMDLIAGQFADALIKGFKDKYINKVESNFVKSNKQLKDILQSIDNERFVILTSRWYARKCGLVVNNEGSKITYNDTEYDCWIFNGLKNIYITKIDDLPKVSFTKLSDKETKEGSIVDNYVDISIDDIWENDALAKEVVQNNDWAKVSDNEEENMKYVKNYCIFNLLIKFSICYKDSVEVYRF